MNTFTVTRWSWQYAKLSLLVFGTLAAAVLATIDFITGEWQWRHLGIFICTITMVRVGITLFNHRYFTHQAYEFTVLGRYTLKPLLAFAAAIGLQSISSWWAQVHLEHHQHVDKWGEDPHTPHGPWPHFWGKVWAFLWAHMIWIAHAQPDMKDFYRKRKLDWLEKIYCNNLGYFLFGSGLFGLISFLIAGWQGVIWYLAAVCFTLHVTWGVNSFSHLFGTRRFPTRDNSTNCLQLILFSPEYYHNNHHAFAHSAQFAYGLLQRLFDPEFNVLVLCSRLGWLSLVRDINRPSTSQITKRMQVESAKSLAT